MVKFGYSSKGETRATLSHEASTVQWSEFSRERLLRGVVLTLKLLVTADRFAGGPVELGQPASPASPPDGVHGGGGDPELRGDPDRPEPLLPSDMDDLADQRRGCPGRPRSRPRVWCSSSRVALR